MINKKNVLLLSILSILLLDSGYSSIYGQDKGDALNKSSLFSKNITNFENTTVTQNLTLPENITSFENVTTTQNYFSRAYNTAKNYVSSGLNSASNYISKTYNNTKNYLLGNAETEAKADLSNDNMLYSNSDSLNLSNRNISSFDVDDFATYNFNKESSKNLVKRIKRTNLNDTEDFSISLNYDYVNNKYIIHENAKNISIDLNYKNILYSSLERIDLADSDIYKFSIALKNNIDIMSNDLYGFNVDLIGVASYWHNKDSKDNKNIYSGYLEADLNYDYNLFNMAKLTTSLNNVLYLNKIHNLYQVSPTIALSTIDSIMFVKPKIYVSYNFNVNNKKINSSYNNKEYDKDGTEIGLSALLLEGNMVNFGLEASREISKNTNNIGCSLNLNF